MSRSSSFKNSSCLFDRSDSQFSETMGSNLGYIDDPRIINLESTKMTTLVTCFGSQLCAFSDMLFSYGGGEKASSTCYMYTGYGSTLNVSSIKATPMTMHAVTIYKDYYVCHGGCSDLRTFTKCLLSPHKLLIINPATSSATKRKISGDIPSPRLSHRMYLIKPHTIFIAGGLSATGFCKDCYLLDITTMECVYACDLPLPLGNFAIIECNSNIYLIGGQTEGFSVVPVFYTIVFKETNVEPGTKSPPYLVSFVKLPDPPFFPRRGHTCISIDKYILLFGGTTGTRYFNDFWIYDSEAKQWREINVYGEPPSKRYGAIMGILGVSIIVAGGSNGIMQLHDAFYISAVELLSKSHK